MIFTAEPNLFVKIQTPLFQRVTGKKGFSFDKNGKFETDNQFLIKILSQTFKTDNLKKCKKCDFSCDNQGVLLKHYRENHKKEETNE